ncbi:hypothetical protein VNO77_30586 [Canavalia gladiata]|uniref:Thaumatin-like protein n=1 Tax=Canavalia gladiata TaxID=3824 RepID=A0AAN9KQD1_CANGL
MINNCPETIWPAAHTKEGVAIIPTGWKLEPTYSYDINFGPNDSWTGLIWARTGCSGENYKNFQCDIGDCGTNTIRCHHNTPKPPISLLRLHLNPEGGNSDYKLDLMQGFNLPMQITPISSVQCQKIVFLRDIRQQCPDFLAVYGNERKIACKSPCFTTGEPKYCCTGAFASPEKCEPNEYTKIIKDVCPQAVSNAFDNTNFSCIGGTSFMVTFC